MYEGEVEKQPSERLGISHVFTSELDRGELLQTVDVTVASLDAAGTEADPTDVTSAMLITNSLALTDDTVTYALQGGVDGRMYKVTVSVTTNKPLGNGGNTLLEVEHLIHVKER